MAFWNRKRSTVHVEFLDASTGEVFAQTDIAADRLPESFEAETTMHLGDQDWVVESAVPMTAPEFRSTGTLRLVLHRVTVTTVDPRELLYSLPTISDELPPIAEHTTKLGKHVLELPDDDWRQVELHGAANAPIVEEHLAAIRAVRETARNGGAFTRLHVRRGFDGLLPASPVCSLGELRRSCPQGSEWLEGVAFRGVAGLVENGFAVRLPSGAVLYGLVDREDLRVLAVQSVPGAAFDPGSLRGLEEFMRARQLGAVDWCGARAFPPPA